MTDLITRLRQIAEFGNICPSERHYLTTGADRIEALEAALREVVSMIEGPSPNATVIYVQAGPLYRARGVLLGLSPSGGEAA